MAFVQAGGSAVHYVEHGPARPNGGRTLVALHGFTADHRMMVPALEPVLATRSGWRRLYLDLPGMGRTTAPDALGGTDDVLAIVTAAIDALVDGPYAVAGLSYGGHLATGLAGRPDARVSALALLAPMVVAAHAERDVPGPQVRHEEPGLVYADDEALGEVGVVRTAETLRRSREEIDVAIAVADRAALDRIEASYGGSFSPPERFAGPGARDHRTPGSHRRLRRSAAPVRRVAPMHARPGARPRRPQPAPRATQPVRGAGAEWLERVEGRSPDAESGHSASQIQDQVHRFKRHQSCDRLQGEVRFQVGDERRARRRRASATRRAVSGASDHHHRLDGSRSFARPGDLLRHITIVLEEPPGRSAFSRRSAARTGTSRRRPT